jgi:tetratricopeptide (TPR) repeat protein
MRLLLIAILITSPSLSTLSRPVYAQDDNESRARAHYEIAQGLYRLGDYRGAIKEFAAGYALVRKPRFLLNIGTMYRKLGDLVHARDLYRQFLDSAPADDAERTQAEEVLKELEDQLRANPPPPEPPSPSPSPWPSPATTTATTAEPTATLRATPPRPHRRALAGAGIATGVMGLACLGGGVASAVLANATANDLTALDRSRGVFDPGKDSLYNTERTLEGVFLGVGAALTVTGVVLVVLSRR